MADAPDSKSGGGNIVWVQVPLPAFKQLNLYREISVCVLNGKSTMSRFIFCVFLEKCHWHIKIESGEIWIDIMRGIIVI